MSSLLHLFSRSGAAFLFAALEIFCFYLIINNNSAQQEVAVESWSLYSGKAIERYDKFQRYLSLEQEAQKLHDENAELLSRLPNAQYIENAVIDSVDLVIDSIRQRYTYIAANIINKSPMSGNIYYVINRGYIHGIEKHQGVFNNNGVLGIVINASQRHAKVMSLHHRDMRLSGGLRGKDFFGSIKWEGGDTRYVTLFSIPKWAEISLGDTVETTGYSNIFPTGIPIGEITEIETPSGENTYELQVKLFGDFYEQQKAYVARNLLKEDLENLENEEQ